MRCCTRRDRPRGPADGRTGSARQRRTYDRAYRRANFTEYTRWFPLRDRCHAGYDLVPAT
ncbi:hypothetical protein EBF04_24080 [Streptomyces sp. I6]|nr:hypothetical protein EBF04_24080 [Streptomyces sp. I6]